MTNDIPIKTLKRVLLPGCIFYIIFSSSLYSNKFFQTSFCNLIQNPLQMPQNYRFSDALRDIEMQQPTRGVHIKRFSENTQLVYGRTCRRVVSIKLLWNIIEITLRHGWSPVNLLHISRTTFYNKSYRNFIEIALWHGCSAVNLMDIFRTSFPKNSSVKWSHLG